MPMLPHPATWRRSRSSACSGSTNAAFVSNFISQHVFLRPEEKQELLEETRPSRRLSKLSKMLLHETSVLGLQHQLEEAAQDRLNQTQQEYLLREQMKIIQAELGESDDPDSAERGLP